MNVAGMAKALLGYARIVPFGETKLLVSSLLKLLSKHTPMIFVGAIPELLAWVDSSLRFLATATAAVPSKPVKGVTARMDSARVALSTGLLIVKQLSNQLSADMLEEDRKKALFATAKSSSRYAPYHYKSPS